MKRPSGKGGRRHLDEDESADWDYAARSIKPLKRAKDRVTAQGAAAESIDTARARPKLPTEEKAVPSRKPAPPPAPVPQTPKKPPPVIAALDRKKRKQLQSGRIEIEARIDLHGMRQDEAHMALRGFLFRAQARGLRWVLVITGKGKREPAADGDEVFPVRDRGVLKRNVPRWLDEMELRPLVVGYSTAAISHGGDGALYVHLRKKA